MLAPVTRYTTRIAPFPVYLADTDRTGKQSAPSSVYIEINCPGFLQDASVSIHILNIPGASSSWHTIFAVSFFRSPYSRLFCNSTPKGTDPFAKGSVPFARYYQNILYFYFTSRAPLISAFMASTAARAASPKCSSPYWNMPPAYKRQ